MSQCCTVADFIYNYPTGRQEDVVLTFLNHSGEEKLSFTFKSLKDNCITVAKNLRLESRKQIPVLLLIEDQADFVQAFMGCILAGFIPAPLPPLRNQNDRQSIGRVLNILKDGTVRSLIIAEKDAIRVKGMLLDAGFENLKIWTIESLKQANVSEIGLPEIKPGDAAYIQFTSGSTSAPKGVVLTHHNVIEQMAMMHRVFNRKAVPRVVGWIPFHHDMGLVGHLFSVLYESGFGAFLPATAFLANPALWLDAIHKYRGTAIAAPTFAFELCTRRVDINPDWDLSCWEQAYVGSETVSYTVLQNFLKKFSAAGFPANTFRPVYGLAEATLLAAGGLHSLDELENDILPRETGNQSTRKLIPYAIAPECKIRIKDAATGIDMPEGTEGEIWIYGPAVATSYFGMTNETHTAEDGTDTGDIGMLVGKNLFITGRKKEIVVVRGVNYSAEDLESAIHSDNAAIRSHDRTACVSYIEENREHLWVFQEVYRHLPHDELNDLFIKIQGNLSEKFGIVADKVIFIAQGLMPKTANYKIARTQCTEQFLSGEMKTLAVFPANESAPGIQAEGRVVIVGMACRFPGGADNPEKFWDLLSSGKDAITEVPPERWDNTLFYDENASVPGKINTKWAGFLDNIADFDPALFGISTFEAPEIDPQQRLLLETSWRLIEQTGWKKEDLAGTDTGVYIGISTNDYLYMKIKLMPGMESFNAYSGLGNANSIAANRLSYFYDLKGPSLAVDTACSSSLTAFHLGVKSILSGECKQAIVGGVNAILSPGPTITLSQFGMMSPEGRCKAFDADANGYVRSEGCGLVMLKLEADAIADGDRILAIVDSTTLGQDGASTGMTYPNAAAQHQLLRNGLASAGLKGSDISYIEAHGTGTRAGDPVEMEQIRNIFGGNENTSCYVGAVKANIGHLEAAAGIAGVIKTVLMFEKKQVPPQIHLKELNPKINLEHTRLKITTSLTDWETSGEVRRAAINSFGFGGSLANAILQEPVSVKTSVRTGMGRAGFFHLPFVLSGHSPEALKAQIEHLRDWLREEPYISWSDLCFTYATARTHLRYKTYFLAHSQKHLLEKLESWLNLSQVITPESPAGICFLFTGQGEHFLRMGKELYYHCPAFKDAFNRCAAAIDAPGQPSCKELAFSRDNTSHWTDEIMQPIHFAIQYSLGILWMECGITPTVMLGHSLGEYAAACLAGCFEPETGMKILKRRGEMVKALPAKGFMATLFMNHEEVRAIMNPSLVSIAAINSPAKTVISGLPEEVNRLIKICEAQGKETYLLKTEQAFHSELMDPMLGQFKQELSAYTFNPPRKKWISSVNASVMTEAPDAAYWARHLRNTVQFANAVEQLKTEGPLHFIEIGPGASTLAALRECTGDTKSLLLRSLTFKKGDRSESFYFLDSIGKLYAAGLPINWEVILPGQCRPEMVPGQVFLHRPYWMQGMDPSKFASAVSASPLPLSPNKSSGKLHYKLTSTAIANLPTLTSAVEGTEGTNWIIVGENEELIQPILSILKETKQPAFWIAIATTGEPKLKPIVQLHNKAGKQDWHAALSKIKDRESRADANEWKIIFIDPIMAENNFSENNRGLELLIPLVQSIRSTALLSSLWIVTHDTQQVDDKKTTYINLGSSLTWGFGKTLFLEHPEIRGGMIDLSMADHAGKRAENIISKALAPHFEPVALIRSGSQYIPQIIHDTPPASAQPVSFRSDGAFIITGGLGGLGLKCADWVVSKGGKKLILISRKTLPDHSTWQNIEQGHEYYHIIKNLLQLESKGAQIETIAMDICDTAALSGLFDRLLSSGIQVRGILHAAGVNWFSKVLDLDSQHFFDTLKIKVAASWELHRHTMNMDLDCFLLFSSVSAIWGSVDLSHYTAANQFMDALSIYRQQMALPALSINWGPWDEVGMSSYSREKELLEKLGFSLMEPGRALYAMEEAIASGEAVRLIADINWPAFQPFIDFSLQPTLFAHMSASPIRTQSSNRDIHTKILESSPADARKIIEQVVRAELRTVTLIESVDSIDAEQRFNFMGMDSLMAISYVATLENYFQLKLSSTLTYNYPTIRALSDYLFELLYKPGTYTEKPEVISATTGEPAPLPGNRQNHTDAGWFVPIQASSYADSPRLYCFPFAGSGISVFAGWSALADAGINITGIQTPGREERADEQPFKNMPDVIAHLLDIFPVQTAPYYLFGHSLGGLMAYEFVLALQKAGKTLPSGIIISGCDAPLQPSEGKIHLLDTDAFIEEVMQRFEAGKPYEERRMALQENHATLRADIEMLETYKPAKQTIKVPLKVICGKKDSLTHSSRMKDWIQLTESDFSISYLDAGHNMIIENRGEMVSLLMQFMQLSNTPEPQPL